MFYYDYIAPLYTNLSISHCTAAQFLSCKDPGICVDPGGCDHDSEKGRDRERG